PMYSRYLTKNDGQALQDIWAFQPYTNGTVFGTDRGIDEDVRWLSPKDAERLGYQTQKPLGLLDRIIKSSCPADGIVLDAYGGCGTTIDAAQRLKLGWISMDITYKSIAVSLKRLEDNYGPEILKSIALTGIPRDMASASALAHNRDDRLRKEFEVWAILTYTNNRAVVNDKKGADGGIDGVAFFKIAKRENAKVVFQVKSGKVDRGDIAKLRGDADKAKAEMAVFITLRNPTRDMMKEAKACGQFDHAEMGRRYDRMQIVTIQEMIEQGARLDLPMSVDVLKKARGHIEEQLDLL
ncbi:MAG TPA: DNA methyltransferase, partial [Acidobacteriaceae bacterium]|nr:DNA methyltransferase [Acidobacteriaceae bacterium]